MMTYPWPDKESGPYRDMTTWSLDRVIAELAMIDLLRKQYAAYLFQEPTWLLLCLQQCQYKLLQFRDASSPAQRAPLPETAQREAQEARQWLEVLEGKETESDG